MHQLSLPGNVMNFRSPKMPYCSPTFPLENCAPTICLSRARCTIDSKEFLLSLARVGCINFRACLFGCSVAWVGKNQFILYVIAWEETILPSAIRGFAAFH